MISYSYYESPIGRLLLVASSEGVRGIHFFEEKYYPSIEDSWSADAEHPMLQAAQDQLTEYFASQRRVFELPLDPVGTEFQKKVWQALRTIPFGETRSYIDIARQLGDPKATRAVGAANGRNPISIVVPCHRVVGADGSLTGYAGGLQRKHALLRLEHTQASLNLD